MNLEEIEWKITQAVVNRILREGMEREADRMKQYLANVRKYKLFLQHRTKKNFLKELQDGL